MSVLNRYKELISGLVMLGVSIFYLVNAYQIKVLSRVFFNAAMFPKILGFALAALSIAQIISALVKMSRNGTLAAASARISRAGKIRVAATLIALIIYLALLREVGFLLMTMFYVFAQILILTTKGKLNPWL